MTRVTAVTESEHMALDLELATRVAEMVRAEAFVPADSLPDEMRLNSVHAQLARLCREGITAGWPADGWRDGG